MIKNVSKEASDTRGMSLRHGVLLILKQDDDGPTTLVYGERDGGVLREGGMGRDNRRERCRKIGMSEL